MGSDVGRVLMVVSRSVCVSDSAEVSRFSYYDMGYEILDFYRDIEYNMI